MTTTELITQIIAREGGGQYTDRASDLGGPTRWGITLQTLSDSRGYACQADDVFHLSEAEARAIYRKRYINDPGFEQIIHEPLRALLADYGVNSGPKAAVKALQIVVGTKTDGILGPLTLAAVEKAGAPSVYWNLLKWRMRFLVKLALQDPVVVTMRKAHPDTQLENLAGWLNRCLEFI